MCRLTRPLYHFTGAYVCAIANADGPSVLALTRQNTRNLEGSDAAKVAQGAYTVFSTGEGAPAIIFAATGSEVELAIDAASSLGVSARVVSMPCLELYEKQSAEYKCVAPPPPTRLYTRTHAPLKAHRVRRSSHRRSTLTCVQGVAVPGGCAGRQR